MGCGVCKEADLRTQQSNLLQVAEAGTVKYSKGKSDWIYQFNLGLKGIQNISEITSEIRLLIAQAAHSSAFFLGLWSKCAKNRRDCDLGLVRTCEESLDHSLELIHRLLFQSNGFSHAIILAQFALKLIITLSLLYSVEKYDGNGSESKIDQAKKKKLDLVRTIRKEVRLSAKLKEDKIPLCTFNFELSRLEIGILSIHDPQIFQNTIQVGVNIFSDLITSLLERKVKLSLFRNMADLVNVGFNKAVQCRASQIFALFASFELHTATFLQRTVKIKQISVDTLKSDLRQLQKQVADNNRWEFAAALADVVARLLLGEKTNLDTPEDKSRRLIVHLPADFVSWALFGEQTTARYEEDEFLGIQGLACLGDEISLESNIDKVDTLPLSALRMWASRTFQVLEEGTLGVWLNEGAQLMKINIDIAFENIQRKIRNFISVEVTTRLEMLVKSSILPIKRTQFNLLKIIENLKKKPTQLEEYKTSASLLDSRVLPQLRSLRNELKAISSISKDLKNLLDIVETRLQAANTIALHLREILSSIFGKLQVVKGHLDDLMSKLDNTTNESLFEKFRSSTNEFSSFESGQCIDSIFQKLRHETSTISELKSKISQAFAHYLPSPECTDKMWTAAMEIFYVIQQCESLALIVQPTSDNPGKLQQLSKIFKQISNVIQLLQTLQDAKNGIIEAVNDSSDGGQTLDTILSEIKIEFQELESSKRGRSSVLLKTKNFLTDLDRVFSDWTNNIKKLVDIESNKVQKLRECLKEQFASLDSICAILSKAHVIEGSLKSLHLYVRNGRKNLDSTTALLLRAEERIDTCEREVVAFKGKMNAPNESFLETNKGLMSSIVEDFAKLIRMLTRDENASPIQMLGNESGVPDNLVEDNLEDAMCKIRIFLQNILRMGTQILLTAETVNCESDCGFDLSMFKNLLEDQQFKVLADLKADLNFNEIETRIDDMKAKVSNALKNEADNLFSVVSDNVGSLVNPYSGELYGFFETQSGILNNSLVSIMNLAATLSSDCQSRHEMWRARERAAYQILVILSEFKQISEISPEHLKIVKQLKAFILKRRLFEQVPAVQNTLDSSNFFDNITQLISEEDQESKLSSDIEECLKQVDELNKNVTSETDILKKQIGFAALQKQQQNLSGLLRNLENVSKSSKVFNTLLLRVSDFQSMLSSQMTEIRSEIKSMREDIRRLAGQTPIEILENYREDLIKRNKSFATTIYIPLLCTAPKGVLLMDKVSTFLKNDDKGVLLITGRAGAGKSFFASKLELHILSEHYEVVKKQGKLVVLIWANLPTLKNPMTGLFDETLTLRHHFMEHQIHELREKIQAADSKLEVVFVLDAYDELRPEFQFRNLFKSNNLEVYRPRNSDSQNPCNLFSRPKVIILCRKELIASYPDYANAFLPIEVFCDEKDEPREAVKFFEEVEIAPFDYSKFEAYTRAYTALEVRKWFERHVSSLRPRPASWASRKQLVMIKSLLLGAARETSEAVNDAQTIEGGEVVTVETGEPNEEGQNEGVDKESRKSSVSGEDVALYEDNLVTEDELEIEGSEEEHDSEQEYDNDASDDFVFDSDDENQESEDEDNDSGDQTTEGEDEDEEVNSSSESILAARSEKRDEKKPFDVDHDDDALLAHFEKLWSRFDSSSPNGYAQTDQNTEPNMNDSQQHLIEQSKQLFALVESLAVSFIDANDDSTDDELETYLKRTIDTWDQSSSTIPLMVRFLCHICEKRDSLTSISNSGLDAVVKKIDQEKFWTTEEFNSELKSLPELKELITTPFMIEIIVQIMPKLKEVHSTLQGLKQELLIVMNEDNAMKVWSLLCKYKLVSSEKELKRTQQILDLRLIPETKMRTRNVHAAANRSNMGSNEKCANQEADDDLTKQIQESLDQILRRVAKSQDFNEDELEKFEVNLNKILRRKPVRRFLVYSEFVSHWIERETSKLQIRASSLTPEQFRAEVWEFSTRLACKMCCDSLTKVTYQPGSILFSNAVDDEWFYYFGVGDSVQSQRDSIRKASPLKESGGVFSFVHKSIQEFLVAKSIRDSVIDFVSKSRIPVQELYDAIKYAQEATVKSKFAVSNQESEMHSSLHGADRFDSMNSPFKYSKQINEFDLLAVDLWEPEIDSGERRRRSKSLARLIEDIASSQLGDIELGNEEAVRDFLLDILLDDIQSRLIFIVVFSLCCADGLHKGRLDHVRDVFESLFVLPLPKRENNTVFHIAAKEGDSDLMTAGLQFFRTLKQGRSADDSDRILLSKNSAGLSVLAVAANFNNFEICKQILDFSHEKEKIFQDCEIFEISLTSLIKTRTNDDRRKGDTEAFPSVYKSAQTAAISSGRAVFEVEIDLTKLQIRKLKTDSEDEYAAFGFGGNLCIGFAKGRSPKEESILKEYNRPDKELTKKLSTYAKCLSEYQANIHQFIACKKLKEFRR